MVVYINCIWLDHRMYYQIVDGLYNTFIDQNGLYYDLVGAGDYLDSYMKAFFQ